MLAALIIWQLVSPSSEACHPESGSSEELACVDASSEGSGAWVQHVFSRYETLEIVAMLHGVSVDELRTWNDLPKEQQPIRGQVLRVQSRLLPRPRQRIRFKPDKDDTWEQAAERYGLAVEDLKKWNARFAKRRSPAGLQLHAWVESRVALPGSGTRTFFTPPTNLRLDAFSVGKPYRGRLSKGLQLPESELYTVRLPRLAYGTSLAVTAIQRAIGDFRHETGFDGEIVIGAMSRQTGRRLPPHRSHQSGRDVDIRLPALAFAEGRHALAAQEVDWPATWALVRAFAKTEVVQVIFLEYKHFRRLRKGGLQMGASPEEIEDLVGRYVRHAKGHTAHIHVRFVCSPNAQQCGD